MLLPPKLLVPMLLLARLVVGMLLLRFLVMLQVLLHLMKMTLLESQKVLIYGFKKRCGCSTQ